MNNEAFKQAAACLKILSNPQRLKLVALLRDGPKSVGEIALTLGLKSHVTSEHLRLMQHCGLLQGHRNGRSVSYEIAEPHLLELLSCIESRFSILQKTTRPDKGRNKGDNK